MVANASQPPIERRIVRDPHGGGAAEVFHLLGRNYVTSDHFLGDGDAGCGPTCPHGECSSARGGATSPSNPVAGRARWQTHLPPAFFFNFQARQPPSLTAPPGASSQ